MLAETCLYTNKNSYYCNLQYWPVSWWSGVLTTSMPERNVGSAFERLSLHKPKLLHQQLLLSNDTLDNHLFGWVDRILKSWISKCSHWMFECAHAYIVAIASETIWEAFTDINNSGIFEKPVENHKLSDWFILGYFQSFTFEDFQNLKFLHG